MALLQVTTENGIVEGLPGSNQAISIFKGIPFAKPPTGDLRWRAPQPAEPWEGVRQCYKFASIPVQPRFSSEGGGNTLAAQEFYVMEYPTSEDCLYLNVWTPAKSADEKLPVGVYFHGGGFETGYSYLNAYDGEGFAKRDIVIVTVAYRLNLFGFLAHPLLAEEDPHGSTGNYGTLDQIAGVEWVKRNIAAFGGDPDNITLFGQSAGGFSVQNLCAAPLLKGRFQRAIMQSGGGLNKYADLNPLPKGEAYRTSIQFLEFLGVRTPQEARELDAEMMVLRMKEFKKTDSYSLLFYPCIDGYALTEPLADYFCAGKQPDIDYLLGCTADEMRRPGTRPPAYEVIEARAREKYKDLADRYLEAIQAQDPAACQPYFEDPTGSQMLAGDLAWCENQLRLGRRPAYMYYFTYVPPGADGAHHSAEHHYVFQTLVRSKRPYKGFDFDLSNELADYWANFIKTGNPNAKDSDTWKPYTAEAPEALIIAKERYMGSVPRPADVAFQADYSLGKLK